MRILKAEAQNFGSYKSLSFDYSNLGLSLITGPTGVGKSTLVDLPCWVLFGQTSKDGAADDVISWDAEDPTIGTLEINFDDGLHTHHITRIRGKGRNDLYWTYEGGDHKERGKDLVDSQKQLEALLGITAQQYLLSSYFHQFSKMDSFFFAKAKERRELLESICDLEFPQSLGLAAQEERKDIKLSLSMADTALVKIQAKLASEHANLTEIEKKATSFESQFKSETNSKNAELESLLPRIKNYEAQQVIESQQSIIAYHKKELLMIEKELKDGVCPTCRRPLTKDQDRTHQLKQLKDSNLNIIFQSTSVLDEARNQLKLQHSVRMLKRDVALIPRENPFTSLSSRSTSLIIGLEAELKSAKEYKDKVEYDLFKISKIYDLSLALRTELLQSTVKGLEKDTNRRLETHFDSAIRVFMALEDSDKVEVTLRNDGFECSYKQLSGGQRRMLTLAFAISVMERTANKAGLHPSLLVFDEALNGLDSELKTKAFSLFQALVQKHESVLLMDHSEEMKELFDNRIIVSKDESGSHVNYKN